MNWMERRSSKSVFGRKLRKLDKHYSVAKVVSQLKKRYCKPSIKLPRPDDRGDVPLLTKVFFLAFDACPVAEGSRSVEGNSSKPSSFVGSAASIFWLVRSDSDLDFFIDSSAIESILVDLWKANTFLGYAKECEGVLFSGHGWINCTDLPLMMLSFFSPCSPSSKISRIFDLK